MGRSSSIRTSAAWRGVAFSCALIAMVGCGGPRRTRGKEIPAGNYAARAEVAPRRTSDAIASTVRTPASIEGGAIALASESAEPGERDALAPRRGLEASASSGPREGDDRSGMVEALAGSIDAYFPPWATVPPAKTITFLYDGALSSTQNGANLKTAIQGLMPGERLEIGTGTYSINSFFSIDLQGSAIAPIWIVAKSGARPVITRPDAGQNAMNIGSNAGSRFLCVRGLEITGGDIGLRLYSCNDVWIDRCRIHDVAGAGLTANSANTARIHLTRNEIHHTAGTGEGMYLGANNGQYAMRDSVIARNWVHHTGGSQGDGIEVKQGSFGNWVVENVVHDNKYPCILLYGTGGGGKAFNVVERNVCWNSGDNVMQVQGEAIVRNNLLIDGNNGFNSHDHQGQVRDLTFVHNTIVNAGRGAQLSNWAGRPNMVFANNVVYSQSSSAISFSGGSAGVTITGNVVKGPVQGASGGWIVGNGLTDFVAVAWDGSQKNATPSAASAILGSGNPAWEELLDITGALRVGTVEAGCYDAP